jgi:hypothetical protein
MKSASRFERDHVPVLVFLTPYRTSSWWVFIGLILHVLHLLPSMGSPQVKDLWSKLRLVGKFTSFATAHVLIRKDVVVTTKVERVLMKEYLFLWHTTARQQKRSLKQYRR